MPATAFALVGDRYHNSDYIRTALTKTLVRGAGVSIDFTDEVTLLNADTLAKYRMLILFRDAMIWGDGYGEESASEPPVPQQPVTIANWMSTGQGQAVRDFVLGGGAAMLCHNVTYIASDNAPFRETLRAATLGHPPVRPYRVRVENANHPITRDVGSFVVTDEQHYLTYDGDPGDVLLRSVNEDGLDFGGHGAECEAGWAFEDGDGRVCYLAPGHTIPALWNPEYVKVQQNAARWLLRDI
ncbi:hypothetical protein CMK11_03125 [Candidatus Poribacteria bacterium]|nr:hypothetical protein [Candidatus Poribacteria bacterium]